jgi:hypothetical protein
LERSDEEILNQLKHSHRAMWFMVLFLLVCLVLSAVLVFAGPVGVSRATAEYFAAGALILWVLVAVFWFGRRIAPPPEANEERILRKRIDAMQNGWRLTMVFFVCMAFTTTFSLSRALEHAHSLRPVAAMIVGSTLAFVLLLYSLAAFYGPGYLNVSLRIVNDELARALHARAFKAGYLALMVMLACALPTILYRPALVGPTLCWVLYAGFAIPTLYYVILQWRAGIGE